MIVKAAPTLRAYYNEIDPKCCAWLKALMDEGWITRGDIDNRSIEDVRPSDVNGYDRVHFFAGIAVWDYVLNQAGWRGSPVWTGSCPCQPFSAAGKGKGFADERHLWPAFFHLIGECRPKRIFGEQVASQDGLAWLDLVQSDLEGAGYACGSVDTCAAGFGSPHIRQRLYWVAHAISNKKYQKQQGSEEDERGGNANLSGGRRLDSELGNADSTGSFARERGSQSLGYRGTVVATSCSDELAHSNDQRSQRWSERWIGPRELSSGESGMELQSGSTGPVNGHWRDVDWLFCRDGKWRPTESVAIEMADGLADRLGYMRVGDRYSLNPLIPKGENRVMRLKGYGNAIVATQAKAFIEAYMETMR